MARTKDVDYYGLFDEAMEYACLICGKLKSIVEEQYSGSQEALLDTKLEEVHKLEHEADGIYEKIVYELNRAFITPIEREDIMDIAYSIDSISDSLEDVAFRFWMFDIKSIRPETNEFLELLEKCCEKAKMAVHEFKNYKKSKSLHDMIFELAELEHQGDVLYRKAIRQLFVTETNPLEVQKWRELLHDMEDCFDKCNCLGRVLGSAMVKNS